MKQTKNHKLNLIEMSDTFSTEPLNENMETIDAILKTTSTAAESIDKRLAVLEAKHVAVGSYSGQDSGIITITLGFEPKAVILNTGILINLHKYGTTGINKTGFAVSGGGEHGLYGRSHYYVAFD